MKIMHVWDALSVGTRFYLEHKKVPVAKKESKKTEIKKTEVTPVNFSAPSTVMSSSSAPSTAGPKRGL